MAVFVPKVFNEGEKKEDRISAQKNEPPKEPLECNGSQDTEVRRPFTPYRHVTPDAVLHGEGPFVAALPAQPRAERCTSQLNQIPMWHSDAAKVGALYDADSVFVKHRKDGSISLIYEQQLRQRGLHGYTFTIVDGQISPSDGVGFVFADRVPCSKNIKRLWSVFANRTGHIVKRMGSQMKRDEKPQLPPLALGHHLTIVIDLDQYSAVFQSARWDGVVLGRHKLDLADMAERVDGSQGYLCAAVTKAGMVVHLEKASAELLCEPDIVHNIERVSGLKSHQSARSSGKNYHRFSHNFYSLQRPNNWRPYVDASRFSNGSVPPYSRMSMPPGFNFRPRSNAWFFPHYTPSYPAATTLALEEQHQRTPSRQNHHSLIGLTEEDYVLLAASENEEYSPLHLHDQRRSITTDNPPRLWGSSKWASGLLSGERGAMDVLPALSPSIAPLDFPSYDAQPPCSAMNPAAENFIPNTIMRHASAEHCTASGVQPPSDAKNQQHALSYENSPPQGSSSPPLDQLELFRTATVRNSPMDSTSAAAWNALWKRLPSDEATLRAPTLSLNNRGISVSSASSQYVGVSDNQAETCVLLEQLRYWLQQGLVNKKQLLEAIEPSSSVEPLPLERTATRLQPTNFQDGESIMSRTSSYDKANTSLLHFDDRTVSAPPAPTDPLQLRRPLSEN